MCGLMVEEPAPDVFGIEADSLKACCRQCLGLSDA
jgi:hypothetical protein